MYTSIGVAACTPPDQLTHDIIEKDIILYNNSTLFMILPWETAIYPPRLTLLYCCLIPYFISKPILPEQRNIIINAFDY